MTSRSWLGCHQALASLNHLQSRHWLIRLLHDAIKLDEYDLVEYFKSCISDEFNKADSPLRNSLLLLFVIWTHTRSAARGKLVTLSLPNHIVESVLSSRGTDIEYKKVVELSPILRWVVDVDSYLFLSFLPNIIVAITAPSTQTPFCDVSLRVKAENLVFFLTKYFENVNLSEFPNETATILTYLFQLVDHSQMISISFPPVSLNNSFDVPLLVRARLEEEQALSVSRTPWWTIYLSMLASTLQMALLKIVRYHRRKKTGENDSRIPYTNEIIGLFNNRIWQFQLVAFSLIDVILSESWQPRKSHNMSSLRHKSHNSNSSAAALHRITNEDDIDVMISSDMMHELCRTGTVRHIIWGLCSTRTDIRRVANKTLLRMVSKSGEELWASLLEQGLVPVLEAIAIGISIGAFEQAEVSNSSDYTSPPLSPLDCTPEEWTTYYEYFCSAQSHSFFPSDDTLIIDLSHRFPELLIRDSACVTLDQLSVVLETSLQRLNYEKPGSLQSSAGVASVKMAPSSSSSNQPTVKLLTSKSAENAREEPKKHARVRVGPDSSEGLGMRVFSAIVYSKDIGLKTHVITGLLYAVGQRPSLGRTLWNVLLPFQFKDWSPCLPPPATYPNRSVHQPPVESNTVAAAEAHLAEGYGALFQYLLMSFSGHDISVILIPLTHFLEISMRSEPTTIRTGMGVEDAGNGEESSTVGPTVVIEHSDGGGLLVKMLCPPPRKLYAVCPDFAALLQRILDAQIMLYRNLSGVTKSGVLTREEEVAFSSTISVVDECHFVRLPGDYSYWQEIFSHITLSFRAEALIASMTTADVIELYKLAKRFKIIDLVDKYRTSLESRIDTASVTAIFAASLGLRVPVTIDDLFMWTADVDKIIIPHEDDELVSSNSRRSDNELAVLEGHVNSLENVRITLDAWYFKPIRPSIGLTLSCIRYLHKNASGIFIDPVMSTVKYYDDSFLRLSHSILSLIHGLLRIILTHG